jgi:hypothetical protein
MEIEIEDRPYCNTLSDVRRKKVYFKMLSKVQADEFGHHCSLKSYLISQYVTFEKTWEQIANEIDVSAGTIQRATESLKIWRKKIRHKQGKPMF